MDSSTQPPAALRTSDFDYALPPELIAQTPIEPRDHSRLLVLHRGSGVCQHRRFDDFASYLDPGDVLVFNESRVLPARLRGTREGTGGRVEVLLLRRLEPGLWEGLVRPGKRLKKGAVIVVGERSVGGGLAVEVLEDRGDGTRLLRLSDEGRLSDVGQMPLPPYIREPLSRPARYQTVYARIDGSAAAPTAGLHFTPELLETLRNKGVRLAFVTVHIGLDTFLPVRTEDPSCHPVHREYGEMGLDVAGEIVRARADGRRVIAVGTSTVRLLEHVFGARSAPAPSLPSSRGAPLLPGGLLQTMVEPAASLPSSCGAPLGQTAKQSALSLSLRAPMESGRSNLGVGWQGWVDTFILPGHTFRVVDAMVTNFHLPRTTLLMLVSAFAGRERIVAAYGEAMRQRYRFYSFGDAMLIL